MGKYSDRITFITHKGKKILLTNFSGLTQEQVIEMLQELNGFEKQQAPGSLLCLGDYTDFHFSVKILNAFNADAKECSQYYKASALVGITGLVKVMYDTLAKILKQEMKLCSTREEALDWLVSKA
jgi:hypothetical protein